MADLNSVVIVGRLTREPELKYSNSGVGFLNISLAVNKRVKKGDVWEDKTSFFDVVTAGKSTESLHKFLSKGSLVGVHGELEQDRWESEGQSRSKVKIFAHSVQIMSRFDSDKKPESNSRPERQNFSGRNFDDPDIPF